MINSAGNFQIYNEHCVVSSRGLRVYGQYHPSHYSRRAIRGIQFVNSSGHVLKRKVRFARDRYDFCVELQSGFQLESDGLKCILNDEIIFDELRFRLPFSFEKSSNYEVAISTMVQNYGNRIVEWVRYHLNLGVSKIVIFDNGSTDHTVDVIRGLGDRRVEVVSFDYTSFEGEHYDNVQRIALSIASHVLGGSYQWVALIDADEFIYMPDMKPMCIRQFLTKRRYQWFRAIAMPSILLTNQNSEDIIDDDVLELCRYSDLKPKYTKLILNTKRLKRNTFIKSPHRIRGQWLLPMSRLYHGHCWVNERLKYNSSFVERDEFYALQRTHCSRK